MVRLTRLLRLSKALEKNKIGEEKYISNYEKFEEENNPKIQPTDNKEGEEEEEEIEKPKDSGLKKSMTKIEPKKSLQEKSKLQAIQKSKELERRRKRMTMHYPDMDDSFSMSLNSSMLEAPSEALSSRKKSTMFQKAIRNKLSGFAKLQQKSQKYS